jgi:hypothetical protein
MLTLVPDMSRPQYKTSLRNIGLQMLFPAIFWAAVSNNG